MDRLNFQYREIFQSTGIPFLDRLYKNLLAPQIHLGLSTLVQSPGYLKLTPNVQRLLIKEFLTAAKKNATQTLQKDPTLVPYLMEYQFYNMSVEKRKVINEVLGKDYIDTLLKEFQRKYWKRFHSDK